MHDYAVQHYVKFTSDQIGSINGKQKTIHMPAGLFDENTKVGIELHSESVKLGSLKTDSLGGINADITLPADTPDGYHALHLYGLTYTGEKVDYYDVINTTQTTEDILPVVTSVSVLPTSSVSIVPPASASHALSNNEVLSNNKNKSDREIAAVAGTASPSTLSIQPSLSTPPSPDGVLGDSTNAAAKIEAKVASLDAPVPVGYYLLGAIVSIVLAILIGKLINNKLRYKG